MPIVTVSAMPEWYPAGSTLEELSNRQLVVVDLCEHLPRCIAEILAEHDFKISSTEVLVRIVEFNRYSTNTPPLWVKVAPMWSPRMEKRRNGILQALRMDIHAFLSKGCEWRCEPPSFDVDVIFDHGAGCSINHKGQVVAEWASSPASP